MTPNATALEVGDRHFGQMQSIQGQAGHTTLVLFLFLFVRFPLFLFYAPNLLGLASRGLLSISSLDPGSPMLPTDVLVFLHPLVELPLRVWELGNLS